MTESPANIKTAWDIYVENLMKECDTCQWHCTDKKRCKLDLPIEEINPMLLENVDTLMHDFYVFC